MADGVDPVTEEPGTEALVPAHGESPRIPDEDTSPEGHTPDEPRLLVGGLDPEGLLPGLAQGLDEDSDDPGARTMPTAQVFDQTDETEGADTLFGASLDEDEPSDTLFGVSVDDADAEEPGDTVFGVSVEDDDGDDGPGDTIFGASLPEVDSLDPSDTMIAASVAEPQDSEDLGETIVGAALADDDDEGPWDPAATVASTRSASMAAEMRRERDETAAALRAPSGAHAVPPPRSLSDTAQMPEAVPRSLSDTGSMDSAPTPDRAPSDTVAMNRGAALADMRRPSTVPMRPPAAGESTGSASAVDISDGDIDEVGPNDTQIAVVMPDESFEPADLALASSDNPLPSRIHPPADAAPIGHGIAVAPAARAKDDKRILRLVCAMGAWALIFGVLFAASIVTGGGRAEARLLPSSAALWLRIALTGGLGGVLVFAFRHSLPISNRAFSVTPSWAAIAVLAGTCVGAMAPAIAPESPILIAVVLGATVAIAEEIFFRGFLGRALAAAFSGSRVPTALAAVLYGVYYATYFVIWQHPSPLQVGLALTMITVGAGLPYALLYDLTKSFTAPLLCHVSLNVVAVLVRTLL